MKKILFLLCFMASFVEAQELTIQQIVQNRVQSEYLYYDMVDATDGYTSETGLTPTCTIMKPHATAYASCTNSSSEIGTGTYRVRISASEYQDLGRGSFYITGTGSRPTRFKFNVIEPAFLVRGSALTPFVNSFGSWTTAGASVTADTTATFDGDTIADTLTGDGNNAQHKATISLIDPGGSGEIFYSVEIKSGTINNAWVGNSSASHIWGGDLNTSTGAFTPNVDGRLRGWRVEQLASSWWRVSMRATERPTDAATYTMTIALGDGTGGDTPSTFTSSGTMVFARAYIARADSVSPELIKQLLPSLQSASSTTSVTLSGSEITGTDVLKNREICFFPGYLSSSYGNSNFRCSCIQSYNGTTKIATLLPAIDSTLSSSYKYRIGGVCLNNVNVSTIDAGAITASAIATDAIGSAEIAADAIGASEIATSAIGADEIAPAAITSSEFAQTAADKVWNTDPTTCSTSNTALCYLEKATKYVANKLAIVGSAYTLYEDDEVTTYQTGTTSSSGRDPS